MPSTSTAHRLIAPAITLLVACGGGSDGPSGFGGSGPSGSSSVTTTSAAVGAGGSGIVVPPREGGLGGNSNSNSDGGHIIGTLPPDFTKTEAGGYKLGMPIMGAGVTDTGLGSGECNEIVGVVRDFK